MSVLNKICSKKTISIQNLRHPPQNFDFIYSQVFFNIKYIINSKTNYSFEDGEVAGDRNCESSKHWFQISALLVKASDLFNLDRGPERALFTNAKWHDWPIDTNSMQHLSLIDHSLIIVMNISFPHLAWSLDLHSCRNIKFDGEGARVASPGKIIIVAITKILIVEVW